MICCCLSSFRIERMSPLGNATAEECANYIIIMFSDYTRKVTMQNLMHDGGFSTSGMTDDLIEILRTDKK